jgi:hypothetical protein
LKYEKNVRLSFYFFVLLTAMGLFFHIHPVEAYESCNTVESGLLAQKDSNDEGNETVHQKSSSRKIIAYYFHGTRRCRTCKKIESLTRTVVQNNFQAELENGSLEWQSVNVDTNENKHFIKEFNLYTKSVVLVEIIDSKQSSWKNLDQVWQLVHKEDNFKPYIRNEIKTYLKGK